MNKDTKSILMSITSIVIGGGIVYYAFYKPGIKSVGIIGINEISRITENGWNKNNELNRMFIYNI
jgi:hypothetical protein